MKHSKTFIIFFFRWNTFKKSYYSRLIIILRPNPFYPRELKKLKNSKNKWYVNPTKIFSYPTYTTTDQDIGFQCDTRRYGIDINNIAESSFFNKYYDLEKLNDININLSGLLLPDLNLEIDNNNYLNLLTHEGYQLKW